MFQELEIKFAVRPEDAERIRALTSLFGAKLRHPRDVGFEALYFDTARYRLRHRGIDLRIKQSTDAADPDSRRATQTLKVASELQHGSGGVLARDEYDTPVEGFELDAASAEAMLAGVQPPVSASELRPVFSTVGRRSSHRIKWLGSDIQISVDTGHYESRRGRRRRSPMSEIELELVKGDLVGLLDLAQRLNDAFPVRQTAFTKSDFGYHLTSAAFRLTPVKWKKHAGKVPLPTLKAQLGRSVTHFLINDPLVLNDRLEAIHQSRVAIRRIRAILRAHKSGLDYLERKGLNGELKWLQERLGEARDWQVFITEVMPRLSLPEAAMAEIDAYARAQTRRKLTEAMQHYESRRARRLILVLQRWTAELDDSEKQDRKSRKKTFRKDAVNFMAIRRMPPITQPNDIHAVRILAKKLRYVFELSPELDEENVQGFRKALKRMQDAMGRYNDLAKAQELFSAAQSSAVAPSTLAALRKQIESQQESAFEKLKPRYATFRRLTRKLLADLEAD